MPISIAGAALTQDDLTAVSVPSLNVVGSPPIGFGTEFTLHPPVGPPRYVSSPPPFLYPPTEYMTIGGQTVGQNNMAPSQGVSPLTVIAGGTAAIVVFIGAIYVYKAWQYAIEHSKVWKEKSSRVFKNISLWILWTISAFIIGAFVGIDRLVSWFSTNNA